MKPRHKRAAIVIGVLAAVGAGRRAGAQRLQQQPGVLLHADAGGVEGSAAGAHVPHRRPGAGRQRGARRLDGALHRHRHCARRCRCATKACCPTCSRKARASSRRASSGRRRVRGARGAGQARRELHAARGGRRVAARRQDARRSMARDAGQRRARPMIPELGHSSLLLALGGRRCAGRRCRWPARSAAAPTGWRWRGPAAGLQFAAGRCWRSSAWRMRSCANDFSVLYVASAIPIRQLPLPYRIAAVWGGHEGSLLLWVLMLDVLDAGGGAASAAACRDDRGARARRDGTGQRRLPAVHAAHLEPVRAPAAGRRRRPRPESAAAGPGHGDPSADALHGLRRILGRVCVRHRGAARRQARRGVGALDAAVDDGRPGCS